MYTVEVSRGVIEAGAGMGGGYRVGGFRVWSRQVDWGIEQVGWGI